MARCSIRAGLFVAAFLTAFGAMLGAVATAEQSRTNVVLIVVDDLGWADLACYGSKFHRTPNLDRLAAEGMRFTQAYAACPVCSPTRAAIMTGRYPQRMNITTWLPGYGDRPEHRLKQPEVTQRLPASEVTIAEVLKPAGYLSASIGKWHLGGEGSLPTDHGFDLNIAGDQSGTPYSYFAPYTNGTNTIVGLSEAPEGEYLTDRLAAEAEKFLEANSERPFFLYLPHYAVHTPMNGKAELVAKYGAMPQQPNGSQINPVYAAMMESMDQAVGRVMQKLDDLKLTDRTLVLFTSDNGGLCNGNGQIIPPTSNAPLRDGKSHLYEGGIRVPLIVRWPGVVKPGSTSDAIVSSIDLFPTIVEACAVSAPAATNPPIDGKSLVPVLNGSGTLDRDAIYWHYPHYNGNAGSKPGAAIRAGEWKLIEFYETGRRELFNVARDRGESNNLIEQNADVAKDLYARLSAWRESVGAKLPTPNPDYTANPQRDDGTVVMHSSTADVNGIMLRYEPLPNKDTLGYWVRQEDWASLDFTIRRAGKYHLIPHVGCGTSGGSLVNFEVAGQTLALTVPATGGFQNFVPQDLGVVTLEKPGRYTLTIKPQKKEGVAVMDVRRIILKPVEVALQEMLPNLHLLEPFWASATVYRESALCVKDAADGPATGKLLFPASRIVAVHSADGRRPFQAGIDFNISSDGTRLEVTQNSRIPFLSMADLFPAKGKLPTWSGDAAPGPQSLPQHKTGDPETFILFNNGHWFHDQQIEVTYDRQAAQWPGTVPQFDPARLPKTIARLKAKQKLTIGVSGDSITYGLNASGLTGAPPFMPMYPDLVAAQLRATYGGDVTLVNRAVGGWSVPNGLADLGALLANDPDLVLIAYGMNDVGRRDPQAYKDGIQQMITRIKAARPQAEIILVATMLGNDQWNHTPREMFPQYRDALASLCGEGIALADLTSVWTEMLKRKRDCDLTGNGVNHPSDFGHRVYASAILSLLVEPRKSTQSFIYAKTPQADLEIIVHYPSGWTETDKRPGIVFFSGGGWENGTINAFERQARYFATRGMVTARADYRVKTRHGVTPKECVEDARSAVRWIRQNAARLGIDPNRIVASGGSAGGHIAACTTLKPPSETVDQGVSCSANALILFNPVLRIGPQMLAKVDNDRAVGDAISPVLHLTKDSPPTLILFGTDDFLYQQGREFMQRSKELGNRAELYVAENQPHGFFNRSPWYERTALRADEFLVSLGYLQGTATIKVPDVTETQPMPPANTPTNPPPPPTYENVKYGPHERHVLDFWKAGSGQPTPVLVSIHGGGFLQGNKSVQPQFLRACLDSGISVAAINYRYSTQAIAPASFHDGARAVQFLRSKAGDWNIDPQRFAATGGSAGAGISLWLGFHQDLADPANEDPVLRQSTRLNCMVVFEGQTSYDPRFIRDLFPGKDIYRNGALQKLFDFDPNELDRLPAAKYKLFEEVSPINHVTKDAPSVLLIYNSAINAEVTDQGIGIHHPMFGKALKEKMDALNLSCEVVAAGERLGGGTPTRPIDFLSANLIKK